jgi:hypothetical protein
MTDQDKHEKLQLLEIEKTCVTQGFGHILQLWHLQREYIIREGKKSTEAGDQAKAAYWMAILNGFDKAVAVVDNARQRWSEMIAQESQQEKTDE